MSILDDIMSLKNVKKIKNGGTANLSLSQVTNLIINLPDARRNLNANEYKNVYELYKDFRKCKTKLQMDLDKYVESATKIIKKFDEIAPYEKYSGGNELEFNIMMDEIRKNSVDEILKTDKTEMEQYAKTIVNESFNCINYEEALEFVELLPKSVKLGKKRFLQEFDKFIKKITSNNDVSNILKVSFLIGALNANKIISEQEVNELNEKYNNEIISNLM